MSEKIFSPEESAKLSDEPGFVCFDLMPSGVHALPVRTPGLLAFLRVLDGREKVLRLLLVDDLAKGFAQSRPFTAVRPHRAILPARSLFRFLLLCDHLASAMIFNH